MHLAVPKETVPGETRVALIPESVKKLTGAGFKVSIGRGAGELSHYLDEAYKQAGAAIVPTAEELIPAADFILKVRPPTETNSHREVALIKPGAYLLGSLFPTRNIQTMLRLASGNVTSFSTDTIPPTTATPIGRCIRFGPLLKSV